VKHTGTVDVLDWNSLPEHRGTVCFLSWNSFPTINIIEFDFIEELKNSHFPPTI
jgi:hypothetical protein